jgi:hypothetical protein
MDIKSHNIERLIELHNVISEGMHKVEDIEESVDSLFLAVMNPEDKKNIKDFQSFSDRIVYITIPLRPRPEHGSRNLPQCLRRPHR